MKRPWDNEASPKTEEAGGIFDAWVMRGVDFDHARSLEKRLRAAEGRLEDMVEEFVDHLPRQYSEALGDARLYLAAAKQEDGE